MIPNPYFSNVPDLGDLELDYVVVENECPIVFFCKDKQDKLYFCNCVTMQNIQKWVITEIERKTIIKYFKGLISNYEIFKNSHHKVYVVTWNYGYKSENYKIVSSANVSDDDLPPKDSYLCADPGEYDDYIEILDNRSKNNYSKKRERLFTKYYEARFKEIVIEKSVITVDDLHESGFNSKYNSGFEFSKNITNTDTDNLKFSRKQYSYSTSKKNSSFVYRCLKAAS